MKSGSQVVGYARHSTEPQDGSVEQQIRQFERYCGARELQLGHVYADRAASGRSIKHREQFQAMIADLVDLSGASPTRRSESVGGVLVWRLDRFARNADESAFYRSALNIAGYELLSIAEEIPGGPLKGVITAFHEGMSEQYSVKLSHDISRGQSDQLARGFYPIGNAPLGFRRERSPDGTRANARLVPEPEILARISRAFQMRAAGYTYQDIHREVRLYQEAGSNYTTLFSNPIYMGVFVYRGGRHEGFVEPAIDPDTFAQVQSIIAANRSILTRNRHPREVGSPYLLSGIIYCGHCGGKMHGSHTKPRTLKDGSLGATWRYYRCDNKQWRRIECPARQIGARKLERAVIDEFLDHIRTPLAIDAAFERASEKLAAQADTLAARRDVLRRDIESTESEIDRLVDGLARGVQSSSISKAIAGRETRLGELQFELAAIVDSLPKAPSVSLSDRAGSIRDALENGDLQTRRRALGAVVERIVATYDSAKVEPKSPFDWLITT